MSRLPFAQTSDNGSSAVAREYIPIADSTVRAKRKPPQTSTNVIYPEAEIGRGLTVQIVVITQELAKKWLGLRALDIQRSVKPHHLKALETDLIAGRFVLNGEPIIFNNRNELIDGQHRLEAVSKTGIPYLSLVVRGADPDVFRTIDGGSKRTGGDALKSLGYQNPVTLAAACGLLHKYVNGSLTDCTVLTPTLIEKVAEENPALTKSVEFTRQAKAICHKVGIPPFCHFVFSLKDRATADDFFTKLVTGDMMKKGNPVLTLRDKLMKNEKLSDTETLAIIIKAWNAVRAGKSLTLLRFNDDEKFPDIL